MSTMFEGARRAHDRDRAAKAKDGASGYAVATQLLGCAPFAANSGDGEDAARCACPLDSCWVGDRSICALVCSTTAPTWRCTCGVANGDTIELVRRAKGLTFGEAVGLLNDFVESGRDDLTGELF